MKKISILLLQWLILSTALLAQTQTMVFEKTTHDFGNINEEKGPVTYEFKFTNKGSTPIIISDVRASCGCTTPAWTKEPVLPGKTGFVRAQFDPRNRPGVFNKTLTITANTEPVTSLLFIKGTVVPKPRTIEDDYRDTVGNMRISSRYMNMGVINTKEPVVKEFSIYNGGDQAITFTKNYTAPKFIKVEFVPETVEPKGKGIIKVTYDAKGKNDYGYVNDQIIINSNDAKSGKKTLNVVATISEYFPPMSPEELAKAAKITLPKVVHDFGTVKAGETVETYFDYTNSGQSELIIRKAKASCGCTAGIPEKTVLKPGETSRIKVTFNSTGRQGQETKTVTIYSNDPSNSAQTLTIKANVTP